jgi:hypothetical protein
VIFAIPLLGSIAEIVKEKGFVINEYAIAKMMAR